MFGAIIVSVPRIATREQTAVPHDFSERASLAEHIGLRVKDEDGELGTRAQRVERLIEVLRVRRVQFDERGVLQHHVAEAIVLLENDRLKERKQNLFET